VSDYFDPDIANAIAQTARQAVGADLQRLAATNQQLQQRIAQHDARSIYDTLDRSELGPAWRELNVSESFLSWLAASDEMAGPGNSKAMWLRQAFAAGDAPRVLSIFRAFVAETNYGGGARQQQTSRRQSAEPAYVTQHDLDRHYEKARRNEYPNEAAKNAAEAKLLAMVNSGRFRRI
jgi:hypothetical protein